MRFLGCDSLTLTTSSHSSHYAIYIILLSTRKFYCVRLGSGVRRGGAGPARAAESVQEVQPPVPAERTAEEERPHQEDDVEPTKVNDKP